MQVIKFRRLVLQNTPGIGDVWVMPEPKVIAVKAGVQVEIHRGEIAFSESDLWAKLDGGMAYITMPAKSWYVRLWRMLSPLKMSEAEQGKELSL